MSLNLVSPGVKVREVDLTLGRIDAVNDQVGAIAGPFLKGPVGSPVLVETEQDLLQVFGKPSINSSQYETWLTASSYLSYGGTLRVVRSDDANLVNAHYPVGAAVTNLKITSNQNYIDVHQTSSDWIYAAKDPGSWGNGLKVCVIDAAADYRIGMGTFGIQVGYAFTVALNTQYSTATGTVQQFDGYLKGLVTQVNIQSIDVKIVSRFDALTNTFTEVDMADKSTLNTIPSGTPYFQAFNNVGTATSLEKFRLSDSGTIGVGQTIISVIGGATLTSIAVGDLIQTLNGDYQTRVVSVGSTNIVVNSAAPVSFAATTFVVRYTRNVIDNTLDKGEGLLANTLAGGNESLDIWYEQQTLGLTNSTVFWQSIAPPPGTSSYASERSSKNDEIHVVVVDDSGSVTGIAGNIVEKYLNLSKASDARVSPSENIYYKSYISNTSKYIYAGTAPSLQGAKFSTLPGYLQISGGTIAWGQEASGINFGLVGARSYPLSSGFDYSSASGGMDTTLGDILDAYEVFRNPSELNVNFLICGPSGGSTIFESQAKANRLIDIAESRKDCIAVISPNKSGVVGVTNSTTQTTNILSFFDSITSSSYAVFDSGYKYMFDRFNNQFVFVPLNGDIAGLMARTSINNFPWFSPAGAARGVINNAVKLAYNPTQSQRDLLYAKRINPVVFSPGSGIILFGDKTALARSSAFDRINVRRLFLTIEDTIERAARAQLFEFNDTITRTNFLNIVEPYLRDVKAKRGITDFIVVCDESNNTPDVIDSNQFKADIFVKPARSINFIGLTFVANRTGVSFEEVVGTV